MRYSLLFAWLLALAGPVAAQEFPVYANGLMYPDSTMRQLRYIVDSLHLKYRSCGPPKPLHAQPQAYGHHVLINNAVAAKARADMKAGISYAEFITKYPSAAIHADQLVMKRRYTDHNDKEVVSFFTIGVTDYDIQFTGQPALYDTSWKGRWIIQYFEASSYSAESVEAFYMLDDFSAPQLSDSYARLVQYADCLVDTTTDIYHPSARARYYYSPPKSKERKALTKFLEVKLHAPTARSGDYWAWSKTVPGRVDSLQKAEPRFATLLADASRAALDSGNSDDELEEFVRRYRSPAEALELKRRRIVVGNCSQDEGPRVHAVNIAILAASALRWEVFLRAHLNVMNDRFERITDGSYAWQERQTYIKELEELDIQTLDLLLGTSLRYEGAATHHYYGSIGRIGRALAESRDSALLEQRLLTMVADSALDGYNRVLLGWLYRNYTWNLKDKAHQEANEQRLEGLVATLPLPLRQALQQQRKRR